MGIGFIVIIHPEDEQQVLNLLQAGKEETVKIGRVIAGQGVRYI
jgi:phosphoribosylformylglycinamidine cyclo-ligase